MSSTNSKSQVTFLHFFAKSLNSFTEKENLKKCLLGMWKTSISHELLNTKLTTLYNLANQYYIKLEQNDLKLNVPHTAQGDVFGSS